MSTRRIDEYLKIFKRRERFLDNRSKDRELEKSHYDRAELAALQWVIRYIEDTIIEAADHQYKWITEGFGRDEY